MEFREFLDLHNIQLMINNKADIVVSLAPMKHIEFDETGRQKYAAQALHKSVMKRQLTNTVKRKDEENETVVYFESGDTFDPKINCLSSENEINSTLSHTIYGKTYKGAKLEDNR